MLLIFTKTLKFEGFGALYKHKTVLVDKIFETQNEVEAECDFMYKMFDLLLERLCIRDQTLSLIYF